MKSLNLHRKQILEIVEKLQRKKQSLMRKNTKGNSSSNRSCRREKIALEKVKKEITEGNKFDYIIKRDKGKAIITKTKKEVLDKSYKGLYINPNPKQAWNPIDNIRGIKKEEHAVRE